MQRSISKPPTYSHTQFTSSHPHTSTHTHTLAASTQQLQNIHILGAQHFHTHCTHTSDITAMGVLPVALATLCSIRKNMYSSYSRRIKWKEPKLAALRRVRSRITMELGGRGGGGGGGGGEEGGRESEYFSARNVHQLNHLHH